MKLFLFIMKKNLTIILLLITWHTLNSQNKVSNYIQFSVGYNPSYSYASSSHDKSLYFLSGEYGKQYKWLDLGISLDYENGLNPFSSLNYFGLTHIKQTKSYTLHSENSFSGIVNAALRLNLRINIIKLLSETAMMKPMIIFLGGTTQVIIGTVVIGSLTNMI